MARAGIDILVFVEDPGAANYVAPLIPWLHRAGCAVAVIAVAAGAEQLARLGIAFECIDERTEAATLLTQLAPRIVLVGTSENPNTLGLKLVAAARRLNILSVGVVDGRPIRIPFVDAVMHRWPCAGLDGADNHTQPTLRWAAPPDRCWRSGIRIMTMYTSKHCAWLLSIGR